MSDGAPLRGATVRLENGEDRERTIATKSTADGHFELRNLPSGQYKLRVSRNGYVEAEYGQKKSRNPGAALTLSAGQTRTDLIFRLIPAAVIVGRIFNEDGEPEPNALVVAPRETYDGGRKTLAPFAEAGTDDLGSYRLFGLAPGRYFVSATRRRWGKVFGDREYSGSSGQERNEQGYIKTFNPGTPEIARAAAIMVKEGDEILGTDIALKQVTVHRVRGRVVNQIAQKTSLTMEVQLVPRSERTDWDFNAQSRIKKPDGSFEIADVAPGTYTLIASWYDPGERKMHSGSQRIDVGESDVEGVSVAIGAGPTVQGRVVWDGKPSLARDELIVSAELVDTMAFAGASARVEADQRFALKELIDGDLRVSVYGASKDCYLKEITFGQTFVKDDVIEVSKGANPTLEITVSSRGARAQGSVVDKDGLPGAGVWVVAVPDAARRTMLRLFKAQNTDQYGKFELHGLAPGAYRLFAWDGVEYSEWEVEDFVKPFEVQGTKLEVRDDDAVTVNLKVIALKGEGTK
jgi:hypothetical protein